MRLFEAAATGTPIISDRWPGLDDVLTPERDVLVADTSQDVLHILDSFDTETRASLARAARDRVLAEHTHLHRARDLLRILEALRAAAPSHHRLLQTAP